MNKKNYMEQNNEKIQMRGEMLSRRHFVELLFTTGVVTASGLLLTGCATNGASQSSNNAGSKSGVIIDANNREVKIPDQLNRIVITCNGGTTHEVAIFGGADKIVAQPSMKTFPQLMKMYPQFNSVTNAGSFDDINIETIVSLEPDIALVGVSSSKGNAQIEDVGIPTYVMLIGWAAIDNLKQEFLNIGTLLDNKTKAQELVDYWNNKLALVETIAAKIPSNERKSVYYLSKPDITKANSGDWGQAWIQEIGANFTIPTTELNGDVTVEKAMSWDPDVIIVQGGNDINQLLDNKQLQDMKAIKNKQVYSCPIGGFWWDRPSPEAILGFQWLAKVVYPDYTGSIDLKVEAKEFFKKFYCYDLSDAEYASFF